MIKYHYAFDENKNIVSINEVDKENRYQHKYYCINCGSEMISKLGEHKAHHFAHLLDAECKGGLESYVHELAKNLFYLRFNRSKSLLLRYDIREKCCCIEECKIEVDKEKECCHIVSKDLDVRKYYDRATLEKKFKNYRADILLEDRGREKKPLMIEIFVKHQCSEEKQKSGIPIFEIKVENEEDAWKIYNEKVIPGTTYNFNQNKFHSKKSLGIDLPFNTFVLNPNGKIVKTRNPRKCNELMKAFYPESCLEFSYKESTYELSSLLLKAKELGFNIKDCAICSNYKLTNGFPPRWVCWLYKKGHTPHYPDSRCAYGCPLYSEISMGKKMDESPIIFTSSPQGFNKIDFSSIYTSQMKKEQEEREEELRQYEEIQKREAEMCAKHFKEPQENERFYNKIKLKWFPTHFEENTFKLECNKDDVPSGFISKNTEIFEGDLIHIDFKPRFNECKMLSDENMLDLYNKDDNSLEHLYIKILFSDKTPQTIKNEDAMVIFVYIDKHERVLDFWNSTYVKFNDFSNCEIRNKKKIIDEIVSYNYK